MAMEQRTNRQLACKFVDLCKRGKDGRRLVSCSNDNDPERRQEREKLARFKEKVRREYEVLKDLCHVGKCLVHGSRPMLTLSSPILSDWKRYSLVRRACQSPKMSQVACRY
jgi:hypothetical protein